MSGPRVQILIDGHDVLDQDLTSEQQSILDDALSLLAHLPSAGSLGPLAAVAFGHALVQVWGPDADHAKGSVITVFRDGKTVVAAPNGEDSLADTLGHELAHSLIAELRHDRESVCLRWAVDVGHGLWTHETREEEAEALELGRRLAELMKAVAHARP